MLKDFENRKPVIETKRLVLREYRREDIPSLREWLGNDELYRFWGRGPLEVERNPELIFDGDGWPRGNGVIPDIRLVIYFREAEKAVGEIQIYDCMDYRIAEIGYRLNPAYRGKGIASEALTALTGFVFENTELDRLTTCVDMKNEASCRVLERAGYTREGVVRHGRMIDYYCDYSIWGMLRDDWFRKSERACESCSLGLYVWKNRYSPDPLIFDGGIVYKAKSEKSFLYPAGSGNGTAALAELKKMYTGFTLERVTESQKAVIEKAFPGEFEFTEDKGSFDYIYDIDDLAELPGRKYSKKRNHINAFLKMYENRWQVEEVTEDNLDECRSFVSQWYENRIKEKKSSEDNDEHLQMQDEIKGLSSENESILMVLDAFDELKPEGIILRVDGECAAFTMGQKAGLDTFDVVFEKADDSVRGAYNVINREFAGSIRNRHPEIIYINRENDLNLPGLRHAKESYRPVMMLKKYIAIKK